MGIVANALAEGLGQTMSQVGTQINAQYAREEENATRWAIEREKMAKDLALRREELAQRRYEAELRWGDSEGGGGSGSGGGRKGGSLESVFADMVKKNPELYGLNQQLPTEDRFTTEVRDDVDPTATGALPPVEGKKYDAEGHAKAKEGIIAKNIERAHQVFNPKDYKNFEEGRAQAMLNDLLEQAQAETDPAKREIRVKDLNRFAIAAGAKERFKVSDGTVVDVATGKTETTEVGKSEVVKNKAAAAESYADAGKARATAATGGMSKTELIQHNTNLRATMGSLERELKSERALLNELPKAQRAEKQRRVDELTAELDAVRKEINANTRKISSEKADEPKKADAPKKDEPKKADSKPPKISEVTGAPAGSRIGQLTAKGWEVVDSKGKVIGHVGK